MITSPPGVTITEPPSIWVEWADARNAVTTLPREALLGLGDLMAAEGLDLQARSQALRERCEQGENWEWRLGEAHNATTRLAALVRDEHDRWHDDPWPICSHRPCRCVVSGGLG